MPECQGRSRIRVGCSRSRDDVDGCFGAGSAVTRPMLRGTVGQQIRHRFDHPNPLRRRADEKNA